MDELKRKFIVSRVSPSPRRMEATGDGSFKLQDGCSVTLESPIPESELAPLLLREFANNWKATPEAAYRPGGKDVAKEGYTLEVTPEECVISASGIDGVRNALRSMRQLAESERGVTTLSHWLLPCVEIEDAPALGFRGIHLCWFPETQAWEIERFIRLAAYYKFNHVVLESWGVIRFDSHPEFCWDEYVVEKSEISRLVELASALGVTLMPQLNIFGHATMSRVNSGKHVLLDRHPEYAPLFEPDGWTWCVSNPRTREYLEDLVCELHDLFGRPAFFHIGCDEAYNAGSCSLCAGNYVSKLKSHIVYFHDLLAKRGARAMMWHDMLLDTADPRWDDYVRYGSAETIKLLPGLPKDMIICDWQYSSRGKTSDELTWPTSSFFKAEGFDVLVCPWLDSAVIESSVGHAVREKLFGVLETTWHLADTSQRLNEIFATTSQFAWNPDKKAAGVSHVPYLNRHLREVSLDMGLKNYKCFGSVRHQINPDIFPG